MGNFFDCIKDRKITVDKQLLNASGSKLREYFCSYRSICEDFIIRIPEYVQIFGCNVKSFEVWDPERKGIIDALEMFAGLIVFSKVAYEDKIKFLYQIFDLNEEGYLDYDELIFMLLNICEATCKIYQLQSNLLSDQIIEQYLDEFFSDETQLKYQDFLRWSYQTNEIHLFFKLIGHPFEPQTNTHSIDKYDENFVKSKRSPYLSLFNYKKESKIKIKLEQRFLNLIRNQRILLPQQSSEQKSQQFNPVTKWIYGIRIDDIRYPLQYRTTQQYKAANEKFIYICGKNVIVLYPKLNMQRNYTLHDQPVSCVEIGESNSIVASGQMGLYPSIHIWDIKTAQQIHKFDRIHKNSIKLLKFIKGNELLVTVSEKYNSSVVILNLVTKQKILSTYLIEPVLNIVLIPAEQNHSFLMVLPTHVVKCSPTGKDSYLVSYYEIVKEEKQKVQGKQKTEDYENSVEEQKEAYKKEEQKSSKIKKIQVSAIVTVPIASMNMLIVTDASNRLFILNLSTKELILSPLAPSYKIVDLLSSQHQKNYFYILYQKSFSLCKIDPDLMLKPVVSVNVPTDLFNLEFVQLIEVAIDCVILVSLMGDVIKVSNFMSSTPITNVVGPVQMSKKVSKKVSLENEQSENKLESSVEHDQNEDDCKQKKRQCDLLESNQDNSLIDYYKYCQIFKIEKISGICFLQTDSDDSNEEPKLIIASSSLIYMIDQIQKELLFLQFFSGNISHIHSVNSTYAIATEQNFLFIMRNRVELENGKCLPANNSKSTINGLKITTDNLIVAIDQEIIMYYEGPNGKYLQGGSKRIKIDHGIPIHISTTSIPKVFLVITKDKAILKLNEESREKNVLSAKELNCDFLQTYYPQVNTVKTPILFSGTKRIFLLAQPNGDIWVWSSLNQMIKHQQSYSTLTGHCSAISELVFTNNGFISSGKEDGMVVVWESSEVAQDDVHEDQDHRTMFNEKRNKNTFRNNEDSALNLQTKTKDQFYPHKSSSSCCMDELLCLEQFMCDKAMLKDSQVQVIAKDGDLYKDIQLNINQIIMPSNLQVYEPLIQRKKVTIAQNEMKNPKKTSKISQKLSLNLKCSFIYGFNSEKSRQSLYYVHHYLEKDERSSTKITSQDDSSQKKKHREVEYTKNVLLPLNQTHQSCRRGFLYYADRMGIVWSPMLKTQFQYDFHVNRITCMAVHPHKNIVCTAEMSNSVPSVHVWDSNSMTMMRYFKTKHTRIISRVQFSRNGEYVISLGGPAFHQSIEIHNWNREERVCYKLIEDACFYDIKSNPYDYNQIAVCGPKNLWIMKVSNRTLIKKEEAYLRPNEQITCMAYTSSIYGNSIESDIITGNSQGDLSLFICGKYIVCKKQAHKKSINCLKLCELFKYKTVVISAGEDNMIKFWDTKFNEITCINTEDVLQFQKPMKDHLKISSVAPQSIDVYHCFTQKDGKGSNNIHNNHEENSQSQTLLLVGTRNGSIFEVKISNEYQGLKIFVVKKQSNPKKKPAPQPKQQQLNPLAILGGLSSVQSQHDQEQIQQSVGQVHKNELAEKLQLNFICHFHNLPATFSRSVLFDTKDNLMITYSRTWQYFVLWNIEKREIVRVQKLENYPMVIKFSKTKYIVVGYADGRINFFQLDPVSLAMTALQQKIFAGAEFHPLNIVFSENDAKIAVVFSKEQIKRVSNNTAALCRDESSSSEGEQILIIYQKIFNGLNEITVNEKNTHIVSSEKRKYKNIFWCDFNTGGGKLLICYTYNDYMKLSNENRRRMMNSFQGSQSQPLYEYLLYDVVRRMEKDLTSEQFNVLNFSPAVRVKYHYYADCKVVEEYYTSGLAQENYDNALWGTNKKKGPPSKDGSGQNPFIDKDQPDLDQITNNVGGSIGTEIVQEFVPVCQMTQFEKFTILGNIYGEIFVMKSAEFYSLSAESGSSCDKKSVKSRCYAIFDSPINNMQVVGNKLLVSAKDCGAVAEYNIVVEEASGIPALEPSEMAKFQSKMDEAKSLKYYESYSVQKIENWLKYVFPKRKNFYEYKLNCEQKKVVKDPTSESEDESSPPSDLISLEPFHIIGRNAYYRRNNILMDLKDNLITFSGCNLLIMSAINSQKCAQYRQEFLKLDNSVFSVNPEISTITLSDDKRMLYAGTIEENCQLIMWDISTRTEMQHICFRGFVSVVLVKVSGQQRHAVVLALDKQAKQFLFFVSLTKFEILASFCISEEPIICDIQFVPDNEFKFLACGINYLAEWSLKGGLLNCQKYSLKNPKDFGDASNIQNRLPLVFYSIIFIKDVAITGGSDGYLYMWNDRNLINSQNANPKAAILTLFTSKNSKIFASGAVDGKANIWHLDSSFIIQKVFQFSLYSGKQTVIPSKFHIQSVTIGKNELFVGTRSGQIHRFEFTSIENNSQALEIPKNEQASNKKAASSSLILSAFDNDQINSCSFNISSQKLYVLTQSGIFSVFNLLTNEKIKEQKIKIENEQIVKMLACKLSNKIYIILKRSIEVYAYMEQGKYSSSNNFVKLKESLKSLNSEIKTGILSSNERYLALLMCPNQEENAKIEIYDMSQPEGKQLFSQHKGLQSIPADIEIIDFSTDNGYLVYKKSDDDETIIDLTTKQEIKTEDIEFQIEWNEAAKRTSKYIRDICCTYSDENKLRTVIQIMNHSVLATDQMGSLRIYRYKQNIEENSIEYYQVYLEHLNDVYQCIISSDCSTLVTVGRHDKSIIIWKIKNFDLEQRPKSKKKAVQWTKTRTS